jgi:LuxR family transcriptional regulator, maltose regulon positive regulatory protein
MGIDGTSSIRTASNSELIWTKLQTPPCRPGMISRKHLNDLLNSGKDRSLIVVSGPPGSGKTSLVSQWIEENGLKTAWYSLDESDDDGELFYRYLVTTLSWADSRFASALEPVPCRFMKVEGQAVLSAVIARCFDLSSHLYLVLDDYHVITSSAVHESFVWLLRHIPPNLHLVIMSRSTLPFSISHFKVRNQVTEISAENLKFNHEETAAFFRQMYPAAEFSSDQIDIVAGYTEGWAGGLQLLGLSLKESEFFDEPGYLGARIHHESANYLCEQVIERQPRRMRRFLLATALLDRFCVELCREVTNMHDAASMLEKACQNNLFLVPLNHNGSWYRYHRLLAETAREKVSQASPEEFALVHRKAAAWFAQNGYLDDAFHHAFASGDLQFAADMLEDYLTDLFDRYEITSFRRWLSKLPAHIFLERSLLRLVACRFNIESVHLMQANAVIHDLDKHRLEAFARYEGFKRQLCEEQLFVLKSMLPFWFEPLRLDTGELQTALTRISLQKTFLPGMIKVVISSSHLFRGDINQAAETAAEATSTVLSSDSLFVKMMWFRLMGRIEIWGGRLSCAEALLERGASFLEQHGLSDSFCAVLFRFDKAWVHYYRNDLAKAYEYTNTALEYLDQSGFVLDIVTGDFLLGLILLAQGDAEGAARCTQRLELVSLSSDQSYAVAFADVFCVRLRLALGDLEKAEIWAARRKLELDEPFSYRYAHECLAFAELLYAREDHQEAVRVLEILRANCESRNMGELLLEVDVLLCIVFDNTGARDRAKTILEESVFFSQTWGYVRPFVNHAEQLLPLLFELLRERYPKDHAAPYLERVFRECSTNRKMEDDRFGNKSNGCITIRETEILRLLAQGHKYQEIADECFISLDTVRTHVKHIFQKLRVETRTQAIYRAISIGILSGYSDAQSRINLRKALSSAPSYSDRNHVTPFPT